MPEWLPVKECRGDFDCGTRICCPERDNRGGNNKHYCRNAAPRLTRTPNIRRVLLRMCQIKYVSVKY